MIDKKYKRKNTIVFSVDNKLQFLKRYIKYLIKKYLKRGGIARFLTVSSIAPTVYEERELLYIQNIQVKEYDNKKILCGGRNRKILKGINSKIDEK